MSNSKPTPATRMTTKAASRVQSASARGNGGSVVKGSFAARAQSAAAKSAAKGGK